MAGGISVLCDLHRWHSHLCRVSSRGQRLARASPVHGRIPGPTVLRDLRPHKLCPHQRLPAQCRRGRFSLGHISHRRSEHRELFDRALVELRPQSRIWSFQKAQGKRIQLDL